LYQCICCEFIIIIIIIDRKSRALLTIYEELHPNPVCSSIAVSMQYWAIELTASNVNYGKINIKCEIFQGDSLSPLLFTIVLIPLSYLLQESGKGYQISPNVKINHLLYMDDIKLYDQIKVFVLLLILFLLIFVHHLVWINAIVLQYTEES